MLNSEAACALSWNTKEVLRWMGTARATVAGSGAAPACSARVSKPGSEWPAIFDVAQGHRELVCGGLCAMLNPERTRAHPSGPRTSGPPVRAARTWPVSTGPKRSTFMKVSDILRVKGNTLFTVTPEQPLADAVRTMSEQDIGSLVVMEHGDLVGMLTFREVIQAIVKNGGQVGNTVIRSVMDDHPLTCTPDTEIDEVRRMMLGRHARYMPVLNGRTLNGVISFYDVAKTVVEAQDFENRMLKAYIRDWPVEEGAEGQQPQAS